MGDVRDFRNFMGAVIDQEGVHEDLRVRGRGPKSANIVAGGKVDDAKRILHLADARGDPDPAHRLLCEEIFGPVMTVHIYPDAQYAETLAVVDRTSPYALTGAVLARDRQAVREALSGLRNAAGNFYINDKPTGAVVGQQPFGGARASGTNDKAGSKLNLLRWVSVRTIKETFVPPTEYRYPFMAEE